MLSGTTPGGPKAFLMPADGRPDVARATLREYVENALEPDVRSRARRPDVAHRERTAQRFEPGRRRPQRGQGSTRTTASARLPHRRSSSTATATSSSTRATPSCSPRGSRTSASRCIPAVGTSTCGRSRSGSCRSWRSLRADPRPLIRDMRRRIRPPGSRSTTRRRDRPTLSLTSAPSGSRPASAPARPAATASPR